MLRFLEANSTIINHKILIINVSKMRGLIDFRHFIQLKWCNSILRFFHFAKEHSRITFLVTRIGCGIAGFRDEEIAPLFTDAIDVENIILPKEFVENISQEVLDAFYGGSSDKKTLDYM